MSLELDISLAKCTDKNINPDIFFMDDKDEEDYSAIQTEIARSICFTCSLREQCLKLAMDNRWENGVWGGTTGLERRVVRNRKRTGYMLKGKKPASAKAMKSIANANHNRVIEVSNRDRELLKTALATFDDLDSLTLEIAKLRIAKPGLPLSELSAILNVSKDVFAGRLRRLLRRLESNGQDE